MAGPSQPNKSPVVTELHYPPDDTLKEDPLFTRISNYHALIRVRIIRVNPIVSLKNHVKEEGVPDPGPQAEEVADQELGEEMLLQKLPATPVEATKR